MPTDPSYHSKNSSIYFHRDEKGRAWQSKKSSKNIDFMVYVVEPFIQKNLNAIKALSREDRLNALTLITHLLFDLYFSKKDFPSSYYRWGGDSLVEYRSIY